MIFRLLTLLQKQSSFDFFFITLRAISPRFTSCFVKREASFNRFGFHFWEREELGVQRRLR